MNKAAAVTNGQGNQLYAEDIDLQSLTAQEVGNKVDIWGIDLRKHKETRLDELINNNPAFNFLASYINRHENNPFEMVKYTRKGSVKEIITKSNTYRCKAYEIHTKRKRKKSK